MSCYTRGEAGDLNPTDDAFTSQRMAANPSDSTQLSEFDRGLLVGILIGEGSFGGDGKQPHVTLRMHVRHEALFRWLVDRFPQTRLYGPYTHGGRSYFQWMARGPALVHDVLPILEQRVDGGLDGHAASRLRAMCERYSTYIERERSRRVTPGGPYRP